MKKGCNSLLDSFTKDQSKCIYLQKRMHLLALCYILLKYENFMYKLKYSTFKIIIIHFRQLMTII